MAIEILDYDHDRDFEAVKRIMYEVGWLEDEDEAKSFEAEARAARGVIFPIDGQAECVALTVPGTLRHGDTDLEMTAFTGVVTGRVARKLGAARRLTARALAVGWEAGSEVAALSMFDQGYYDRLGFGTGAYSNHIKFDPATLRVDRPFRPPRRLTGEDWRDIYQAMHARLRGHGSIVLNVEEIVYAELSSYKAAKTIGLGYYDGPGGTLSHFLFGQTGGQDGPYDIRWYAYQSTEQLLELLALIRSLGDQVYSLAMKEPPEIQFQDLLRQPARSRDISRGSKHAAEHTTRAHTQVRILDLAKCLAKTHLDARSVTFNLQLSDPVAEQLGDETPWRGVAGDYIVTLGEDCSAQQGRSTRLPTLRASVGAFSRLWLGVRNASSLAVTDDLRGDWTLLRELDRALRQPQPHFGWPF